MQLGAFIMAATSDLDAGRSEVVVGLAKVLRTGSRIYPSLLGVADKAGGRF